MNEGDEHSHAGQQETDHDISTDKWNRFRPASGYPSQRRERIEKGGGKDP